MFRKRSQILFTVVIYTKMKSRSASLGLSRMCGPSIQQGSSSSSSEVDTLPNKILRSPLHPVPTHLGSALTGNPSDIRMETPLWTIPGEYLWVHWSHKSWDFEEDGLDAARQCNVVSPDYPLHVLIYLRGEGQEEKYRQLQEKRKNQKLEMNCGPMKRWYPVKPIPVEGH